MKLTITCIFLFIFSVMGAQNNRIVGKVTDSLGVPLEMATVIAMEAEDGNILTYAITDDKGNYELALPQGNFLLKASFLGLKPEEKGISPNKDVDPMRVDFVLMKDENQLDDVEIKYEMPVTKRGDTLIYNADSFTNGTERKLGDLLKKLPGVNVNDNGDIEVEGKIVSKVMVEGKEFFDGDSKLATKNIPADAVSKVEVLKNHNDVNQMRGLGDDQDNVAINLKLKEGKKNFWFGEVEGGAGEGEGTRYSANSRLFYYSTKGSINLLGNLNNVGDVSLTFRDYFNFMGGFQNSGGAGTSININSTDLGFLTMQNDRANDSRNTFGAANFSYELSDYWDISGFSLFSDTYTGFVNNTIRRYIQSGATEQNYGESEQRNNLGMAKLSSIYKPSERFQLDYDVVAKLSDQKENTNAVSLYSEGDIENPVDELKRDEQAYFQQNASAYFTLNDKNIFAGYFTHLWKDEDPFYNAIVGIQPFLNILPLNEDQENFNVNQSKRVETNKLDLKLDYYMVINNKSNINITGGTTQSWQNFNSSIFQILDAGSELNFDETSLRNNVFYSFKDYFMGFKYKTKTGIFTFTPGINLHNYNTLNTQSGNTVEENDWLLTPSFLAIAQFRQNESLRFNYNVTADFTDIGNLAEGFVFNDFNRLFRGNRNLEKAVFHNWSLTYYNFNMFNFTNIYGGVNYNKRINPISSTSVIEDINLVSTPVNSNFSNETFSFNGSFEKTFKIIKTKLNTGLYLDYYNLLVNGEAVRSKSFTSNYTGSILTNFKKSPHFEVGYSRSISQYANGNLENVFYTDKPFANVEVKFLKGFSLVAEWNYYNYSDKENTLNNEYSFVEATLFYQKPNSKWEFSLDGRNLLNVRSLNRDSFNVNYSSTSEYFVQPGMVLATIKYNI